MAEGCRVAVPARMLMCKPHWFALPRPMRDRVWDLYRPGQEMGDPPPTDAYYDHIRACVDYFGPPVEKKSDQIEIS